MKIFVQYLTFNDEAPAHGYWDQQMIDDILERINAYTLHSVEVVDKLAEGGHGIIIIPGRQNIDKINKINEYISHLDEVFLIITGDEESLFPVHELKHDNMKLWLMTPRAGTAYPNVDRFLPDGYTSHFINSPHYTILPSDPPAKSAEWFLSCQDNHDRRHECIRALNGRSDGELHTSQEFAGGLSREEYRNKMINAKIVPCPGGIATPDSFRVFEALEVGALPIVDKYSHINRTDGYWEMIFGDDIPFPVIDEWDKINGMLDYYRDTYPWKTNQCFAKWQIYKRNLMHAIINDYCQLVWNGSGDDIGGVTVIIPTSPIQLHPDTSIIEETIASIRKHLSPMVEIIITFDGVRSEQAALSHDYDEYIRRVLWMCNTKWQNVTPIVFDEHLHQVGMLREALKYVKTNKILYVEHDAPLTPDCDINWKQVAAMIDDGTADLIRFHFEAHIPEEHQYLMLDKEPTKYPAIRTIQWSQRPHLASVDFYKRILADHFSPDARTFIEDKMHSIVVEAYKREQLQGWDKYKLWIYYPDSENIKRSYHTDGRGSEPKYNMTF